MIRTESSVRQLAWPISKLPAAVAALGQLSGVVRSKVPSSYFESEADLPQDDLAFWVSELASQLDVRISEKSVSVADLSSRLAGQAPCLFAFAIDNKTEVLAILRCRGNSLFIVAPNQSVVRVNAGTLAEVFQSSMASEATRVAMVVERLGLRRRAKKRIAAAMLANMHADQAVGICWELRSSPEVGLFRTAAREGLIRLLLQVFVGFVLTILLGILGWFFIGMWLGSGVVTHGWIVAWFLVALSTVPLEALLRWWKGQFSVAFGTILKRRLLHGLQRLDADEARTKGSGEALAQVLETQAFEATTLDVAISSVLAAAQIMAVLAILSQGVGGLFHAGLFMVWTTYVVSQGVKYHKRRSSWTKLRMSTTAELTEQMVGYRTRLIQGSHVDWQGPQELQLRAYLDTARKMDEAAARIRATVIAGWIPIGLLGLLPSVFGADVSVPSMAVAVGGIILGGVALQTLSVSAEQASQAVIAWQQVAPIYRASRNRPLTSSAQAIWGAGHENVNREQGPLLRADSISFSFYDRAREVLSDCSLQVSHGERVLLMGASGSGKSTLVEILAGLRDPTAGSVFLEGSDIHTLGHRLWRRRVVMVPQFHVNYIYSDTLSFNLLMGRGWPALQDDVMEALEVCRELGLGPLIERMPLGLDQVVGEQGWQLSHGERSRIFVARALLQRPELLILDESLNALDPRNFRRVLECVIKRSQGLLLIAHP